MRIEVAVVRHTHSSPRRKTAKKVGVTTTQQHQQNHPQEQQHTFAPAVTMSDGDNPSSTADTSRHEQVLDA